MPGPTVVVTAVGGGGNGEQIIKALRLSDRGYVIVGTDMSAHSKGLYEVDHAYTVPPAGDPTYLETVLHICARHNAVALFPGSEPELRLLSARRAEIEQRGLFLPINPTAVIDLCMDKVRTCEFLAAAGFAVPRWWRIRSVADLTAMADVAAVAAVEDLDAGTGMPPMVLKPSVGGGGSTNLFLAQTPEELAAFGRYLLGLYPEFIAQEYVGRVDSEYTVGVLHTMDGAFVNSIGIRRHLGAAISTRIRVPNRSGRPELGPTLMISSGFSHGDIGRFPEVTGACERIAKVLDARGAINVQCRLVDGEVVVFEINPRFSGTTSLRAMVGYNEPDVLLRHHLLGEPAVAGFGYRGGTILRGLSETLVDETSRRPTPSESVPQWARVSQ